MINLLFDSLWLLSPRKKVFYALPSRDNIKIANATLSESLGLLLSLLVVDLKSSGS